MNSTYFGSLLAEWKGNGQIMMSQKIKTGGQTKDLVIENSLFLNLTFMDFGVLEFFPDKTEICLSFEPQEAFMQDIVCSTHSNFRVEKKQIGNWVRFIITPKVSFVLERGESLFVKFDNMVCFGEAEKMICLCMQYSDGEEENYSIGYLPFYKKLANLKARKFVSNRSSVGILDWVDFNWEVIGHASKCLFLPGYDECGAKEINAVGNMSYQVTEDTEFAIYIERGKTSTYVTQPVIILEPEIIEFKADKTLVVYGQKICLSYKLKNTYHAYIDNGIGRVEVKQSWDKFNCVTKGEIESMPIEKETVYTLNVLGKNALIQKEVRVSITNFLEINQFTYIRKKVSNEYFYELFWDILNCAEISILPINAPKLEEPVDKNGRATFKNAQKEAVLIRLECKGAGGQHLDLVFKPDEIF